MLPPSLVPDAHCLLLFFDFTAVLPVHTGPLALTLLLILRLEYPPKLGDQRGCAGCHTPGVLLLNLLQQISGILVTVGCCFLQIFETLFPVRTDTVSEIIDPAKLIFRKRIAILCRLPEVEDGLFNVLPAFFLEIDLAGDIGSEGDVMLCQFFNER